MWMIGRVCVGAVFAMTMVACGGSGSDPSPPEADDAAAATDPSGGAEDPTGGNADGGVGGGSYGTFTVDGNTVRYAMSGLEYSQVEGIDDTTLENCDPSFFNAGLVAIGYPVDENGELVLDDKGAIDGIVDLKLPNDPANTELMGLDARIDYGPTGLDAKYHDYGETGDTAYSIDGNTASGTIVMLDNRQEPVVVDFEVVCAAA